MVDPVNLNIPGLDYFSFAVAFVAVVALFTLLLARVEIAIQRERRARATENSALLESRRIEGSLEWITVQSQATLERARNGRTQQRLQGHPETLIEEAED